MKSMVNEGTPNSKGRTKINRHSLAYLRGEKEIEAEQKRPKCGAQFFKLLAEKEAVKTALTILFVVSLLIIAYVARRQ